MSVAKKRGHGRGLEALLGPKAAAEAPPLEAAEGDVLRNVAIDSLLGALPFIGDLFDFLWKANEKNMVLLEHHATQERRAAAGDWLFVAVSTLAVVAIAAIPFLVVAWIVAAIRQYFS